MLGKFKNVGEIQKMGLFKKKEREEKVSKFTVRLIDGLDCYMPGSKLVLELNVNENKLTISAIKATDNTVVVLDGDRVLFLDSKMETIKTAVHKNKSSIGRGVAGGLLLGPVGAIVGGVSGVGGKTKTQTTIKNNILLRYLNAENEEIEIRMELSSGGYSLGKTIKYFKDKKSPEDNIINL